MFGWPPSRKYQISVFQNIGQPLGTSRAAEQAGVTRSRTERLVAGASSDRGPQQLARTPRWISPKVPTGAGSASLVSTPPTSDAVLSPEIEYVRRLCVSRTARHRRLRNQSRSRQIAVIFRANFKSFANFHPRSTASDLMRGAFSRECSSHRSDWETGGSV